MTPQKPTLFISMGDPLGIGPEITVKALAKPELHDMARLIVVGSSHVLRRVVQDLGIAMAFVPFQQEEKENGALEIASRPGRVPLVEAGRFPAELYEPGTVKAEAGAAAVEYVREAARLAQAFPMAGIVTGPINKQALQAARVPYPGHTELLAALFHVPVETMFVVGNMRIFFLTRHMSLRQAIDAINKDRLLALMEHVRTTLSAMGIPDPRIGVAGLNPHAGEDGLFGTEEIEHIAPAVAEARRRGWRVTGPVGADSIFHQALEGRYDAVISLYHDQGHIAAKTYDFHGTVSVTTGLPIVRASVDHGTAFDIAGKGIADERNMVEAIRVGARLTAMKGAASA